MLQKTSSSKRCSSQIHYGTYNGSMVNSSQHSSNSDCHKIIYKHSLIIDKSVLKVYFIEPINKHCGKESKSVRTGNESTAQNATISASTTSPGTSSSKSPPLKRCPFPVH
jgi:hypothetical protein